MPRPLRLLMIFAACTLVCGVAALAFVVSTGRVPRGTAQLPEQAMANLSIPAFTAIDQDNKPVDRTLLLGNVTIVGFVFTNCPLACPNMTFQMSKQQQALKDTPVRLLSLSLDPANDTPAVLKAYGEQYGADFSRWTLATAPPGVTRKILGEDLKMHVAEDAGMQLTTKDGKQMNNIQHPPHLFLIGPDARVLGLYNANHGDDMARLTADARQAAQRLAGR